MELLFKIYKTKIKTYALPDNVIKVNFCCKTAFRLNI